MRGVTTIPNYISQTKTASNDVVFYYAYFLLHQNILAIDTALIILIIMLITVSTTKISKLLAFFSNIAYNNYEDILFNQAV